MARKIQVLVLGAVAGFWLGPIFFDESGPGFGLAYFVSAVVGAFVAVLIYEVAARRAP